MKLSEHPEEQLLDLYRKSVLKAALAQEQADKYMAELNRRYWEKYGYAYEKGQDNDKQRHEIQKQR